MASAMSLSFNRWMIDKNQSKCVLYFCVKKQRLQDQFFFQFFDKKKNKKRIKELTVRDDEVSYESVL